MNPAYQAKGVRWDLSDLYLSPQDPRLEKDLRKAEARARAFEEKYKPGLVKISRGSARDGSTAGFDLARLLRDLKVIVSLIARPMAYAGLSFAEKTDRPGAGAFLQKIKTRITDIEKHLTFWGVLWPKLGEEVTQKLMHDPRVSEDRHYLRTLRKYAPHTLSEPEENIMAQKSNTGSEAFTRLFDETVNRITFDIELGGRRMKKTEGEILALFHSPVREIRRKASESLARGITSQTHLLAYIFNMILADERLDLKVRKYRHPMDPRNLANETDLETVRNLIASVKKRYPLVRRYYRLKKKLLGLKAFYHYDCYAPLGKIDEKVPFDRCRKIVLDGYFSFSPKAGGIVEQFFKKRWIDAEVRSGKQAGGFCAQTTPEIHPYILVNYTGTERDVMTVAHELGHGLHQYLARRAGILESDAPLTLAETASVFGEMLIFEKMAASEKDTSKRLHLLLGEIDDHFATVFRQIVITDFELRCHEAAIREGELSEEKMSDFWVQSNREMFGPSVKLTEHFRQGWKYIPHLIHTPFYCYAYAFAQLFVLTLYEEYKKNRDAFIPKYFEMLSLGGSRTPEEIARLAGLDIRDKRFWDSGLDLLVGLVREAETLAKT